MKRAMSLNPVDVPVALAVAVDPGATYMHLAEGLGISTSMAHASVRRLIAAGLVRPDRMQVIRHALLEFVEYGVRYVFPAEWEGRSRGVPTSYGAPPLSERILSDSPAVWPDPRGPATGDALLPLYAHASELPWRSPAVYELLALVDAVRSGRARERSIAMEEIGSRLAAGATLAA